MTPQAILAALTASGRVLARFGSPTCGPCKSMEPALVALESAQSQLSVVRIDVTEVPEVAAKFGVRAVPTLILLEDGAPLAVSTGAKTFSELQSFVNAA